ncbi:YrdB family protein [Streptomyces laculatispora]|uniref:YrdB family protein n=1 Tax=Streptomyces laculatispora TaxID=887464 RepID=UPI001A953A56|nr:YrdB family protein [Streptomyces laculatispora]MBO0919018.1 YrdB family protein [Streptomyces laculatispora]
MGVAQHPHTLGEGGLEQRNGPHKIPRIPVGTAWGYGLGDGTAIQLLLGVVVLAVASVVWGLFCAPRARFRLPLAGVLAFKALVLGGSAVALYSMGHSVAGVILGAVMVVNTALAETFRRRPPAAS